MGRRNEHTREQQREMALTAAELVLVREGMGGLTMRKVAKAIGYTVGNLYLVFANQDDLLAAVNERTADAVYTYLRDRIEPVSDPLERVRVLAKAYIEFAERNPQRWRMLFEHQLPPEMRERPARDLRSRRLFELVESSLAPLLPEIRGTTLRDAATELWGGVHGLCMLSVTGSLRWSGREDYRPLCDDFVRTFVTGLSVDGRTNNRTAAS